ncbi:hypothetical protein F511_37303 [Dorcoceras hygrometricum]|uniref:DUF4219 domain-containing protein n=1 Tax=Dorcoceras hygrometricum TaxID=472368 RepID=A0A2Z7BKT2_9LAMI|nr:hypothetical protein F511_37303 [Dorcoceras hygrometricum]
MSTSHNKIPMFSKEDYDDWKTRMQAHLAAQDDDMCSVITDGPMKIMKINIAFAMTDGAPKYVEKRRHEYTNEEKKKANLDNVARDILFKTLDKNMFSKIKTCATAKEIWEKLIQICEGNDETSVTPSETVQRARLTRFARDLSRFSAKFLRLGLRNRVLLFSALCLLQYLRNGPTSNTH